MENSFKQMTTGKVVRSVKYGLTLKSRDKYAYNDVFNKE